MPAGAGGLGPLGRDTIHFPTILLCLWLDVSFAFA
jgi:hypothetical protein